jgi:hypothetical protein
MRYLRPIGLFAVISSGILMILGSATTQTRHPMADEFQRTIPKCFNDRECERKWAAAQAWIVKRAAYKIQVATSSLIETYNPPSGSTGIAARVVKEPISDNGYQFIVSVWCGNIFGCRPDSWDAAIDFNRTINAVATVQ